MKPTLDSAEMMNRAAATRSQFLAETGFGFSLGSSGGSASPGPYGSASAALAGPRLGEQPARRRGSADHPVRVRPLLGRVFQVPVVVAHRLPVISPVRSSRRFAVIHMAASTSAPMPPSHATSPSVVGPMRPRLNPPGFASARVCVT